MNADQVGSVCLHMPRFPLVTLILVALNVLVFRTEAGSEALCYAYGLIPAQLEPAAFVTSLFLHDPTGWGHLAGNMAFLAVFGALVEGALGGAGFLLLYMAAGAAGGLLHVAVDPGSTVALVGASGSIFGILAVAAVLRPGLLGFVLVFGGFEIYRALTESSGSVSFGCHLGGLFAGALVAAALRAAGSEALETA